MLPVHERFVGHSDSEASMKCVQSHRKEIVEVAELQVRYFQPNKRLFVLYVVIKGYRACAVASSHKGPVIIVVP